jgi:hypothetical protein
LDNISLKNYCKRGVPVDLFYSTGDRTDKKLQAYVKIKSFDGIEEIIPKQSRVGNKSCRKISNTIY